MMLTPPKSTLFPYTTLFRSRSAIRRWLANTRGASATSAVSIRSTARSASSGSGRYGVDRSEEHTSELQSPYDLVCRLLLEKKKNNEIKSTKHTTNRISLKLC